MDDSAPSTASNDVQQGAPTDLDWTLNDSHKPSTAKGNDSTSTDLQPMQAARGHRIMLENN